MDKAKLFRIALTVAGLTSKEWAALHGIAEISLYRFLRGDFPSARLEEETNTFMEKHLNELQRAISKVAA